MEPNSRLRKYGVVMRSGALVVAALAVVSYAAPGCPAGSLDAASSASVSQNIEVTSGLLSSDPSNLKSTLSGSSNVVATGAEQTSTGKLNAILNDPSLLASAPGSSDVPVPASPALPGTASEFGGAAAGHLPGD